MVRATAANAQIRAFACTTRETVETARAAHNTSPVVTAALGRLLSAGVMMGSMLKGDDELITLQIKGDGPIGGLTVTADRNGHDIEVDVEQGDIISFRVDEGMNNAYDTTIWTPIITYNFYREY